jgi:hypothetical protein
MKLSKRLLSILNIVLLALTVSFVYGYLSNLISYKYEVQSDQFAGNMLNGHQREIIDYISSFETGFWICLAFFLVTFIVKIAQPDFKGRIVYVR